MTFNDYSTRQACALSSGHAAAHRARALGRRPACRFKWLQALVALLAAGWLLCHGAAWAASPPLSAVVPGKPLSFPSDFGAHPDFRNEWWYVTGWLEGPDGKPVGFQVTFFRVTTDHDASNPSRFAPKEILLAHAALSDPALGKLMVDEKTARTGFGLAYAKQGNTDIRMQDWILVRQSNGKYLVDIRSKEFGFQLALTPTQQPMLQGDGGFSRKSAQADQASYYYSEPQLAVEGRITRKGSVTAVSGKAWLDHEWFNAYLDPAMAGWDWVGANLEDGSALMAFRIRSKEGKSLWSYAAVRDKTGKMTVFRPEQVQFQPRRTWRSPRTGATYPVAMTIVTGPTTWQLDPLQADQELDTSRSTRAVYWEGAVTLTRDGHPAGRGYLELTGYLKPLRL